MKSPGITMASFAFCLSFGAFEADAQSLARHPYLQRATPGSITIVWRTLGQTIPIVRYGEQPDSLDVEVLPVNTIVRLAPDIEGPANLPRLHSAPADHYQYETSITGLQPDTTYYYGVYHGDQLLAGGNEDHRFTTLPQDGLPSSLRLWITGDTGEGSPSQIASFDAMRTWIAEDGRPVDAYLHLGDMAYEEGLDSEFSSNFFDIYRDMICNTVIWPTMGNHEGCTSSGVTGIGPYYDAYAVPTQGEAGGTPSGTEAYYSFDIGPVHFICLNSHDLDRSPTGAMAQWLEIDLETTNADWLIAFWHHPPYTKGSRDSDYELELIEMREWVMPILEAGGIDLVLAGHSHVYERSMLIDGAYSTPSTAVGVILDDRDGDPSGDGPYRKSEALNPNEGTISVVAGNGEGSGAIGRHPLMRATITEVGSLILDIDGDTATGRMINTEAEVSDTIQLVKRGIVTPEVVQYPWQPVGPTFLVERFEPGMTQVEVFPLPAAPDAAVHYTTDGTTPSLDSPVADGPVQIIDSGIVNAFSSWDAGERTSLTGSSAPLSDAYSLHRYTAAGSDDGYEDSGGNVFLDAETIMLGQDGVAGLRFTDIRIPQNAYIVDARVQFHKADPIPGERQLTNGTVFGELTPNSITFANAAQNLSTRPRTTTTVDWVLRPWSGFVLRDLNSITPDLCEIIAELVSQPDWQSGNALTLLFEITGDGRTAHSFESAKHRAATLSVVMIDPNGLAEAIALHTPDLERLPNGHYRLRMRWPDIPIAEQLGLSREFEASPDLQIWTVFDPLTQHVSDAGPDGFGDLSVLIDPSALQGDTASQKFRVRVNQVMP